MSDVAVLSCRQLAKTFVQGEQQVEVLTDVNFDVGPGQRVAIVGSSGSGKSTLLHLLGGLDQPTAGSVFAGTQSFAELSERARGELRNRALGFVYQFHHLLPEFTALENVAMPLLIGRRDPATAQREAKALLDSVGLAHRVQHKPAQLSGGERQRVAIARALVTRPDCILADEPTGNLDHHTADQVLAVMLRLNEEFNTALVVVTHDMRLARRMDAIYRLDDGVLTPVDPA